MSKEKLECLFSNRKDGTTYSKSIALKPPNHHSDNEQTVEVN